MTKNQQAVPPRQVKTRAKNKDTHPGNCDRAPPRCTPAEVENERAAKAQAKEAHDLANEDTVDATPRIPKQRPTPRNRKKASLAPIAEAGSEDQALVTEEESGVESDPPPPKRLKTQTTEKVIPMGGRTPAKKGRKAAPRAEEKVNEAIAPASDDEPPRKLKKAKPKLRDEINMEMKRIEEEEMEKTGGDMVQPTSIQQAGEGLIVTAPQTPLKPETRAGGTALKRMGAIANISAYRRSQEEESKSCWQPNDNNPISDSYTGGKRKHSDAIREWSTAVPKSKPTSSLRAANSVTSHSRAKSAAPSRVGSAGRSTAPSVLTGTVNIISQRRTSELTEIKPELTSDDKSSLDGRNLSDKDDDKDDEWEVAHSSPPRGEKRFTNDKLITQTTARAPITKSKRPRNENLPDWIDVQWFRHTFVTTYMAFVGETANPWDVPIKQAILVMQRIWDATSSYEYEITASTAVYRKTFAAHLSAIDGFARVSDLHDKPFANAAGALGLAAASVERALVLIASGALTIAIAHAGRGKTVMLPRTFNHFSGKESIRQTGFNDSTWGKATRLYTKSACALTKAKFGAIVEEAQPFVKMTRVHKATTEANEVIEIEDDDERACPPSDNDD